MIIVNRLLRSVARYLVSADIRDRKSTAILLLSKLFTRTDIEGLDIYWWDYGAALILRIILHRIKRLLVIEILLSENI